MEPPEGARRDKFPRAQNARSTARTADDPRIKNYNYYPYC